MCLTGAMLVAQPSAVFGHAAQSLSVIGVTAGVAQALLGGVSKILVRVLSGGLNTRGGTTAGGGGGGGGYTRLGATAAAEEEEQIVRGGGGGSGDAGPTLAELTVKGGGSGEAEGSGGSGGDGGGGGGGGGRETPVHSEQTVKGRDTGGGNAVVGGSAAGSGSAAGGSSAAGGVIIRKEHPLTMMCYTNAVCLAGMSVIALWHPRQELTLVHFSAQPEPFLPLQPTRKHTLKPKHPLNMPYKLPEPPPKYPLNTPIPTKGTYVEPKSGRV